MTLEQYFWAEATPEEKTVALLSGKTPRDIELGFFKNNWYLHTLVVKKHNLLGEFTLKPTKLKSLLHSAENLEDLPLQSVLFSCFKEHTNKRRIYYYAQRI
jgi:hypothetical protein